jgi:hypothetical protein
LREARELESPTHTPELTDFSRKLMLILNPGEIDRRRQRSHARAAKIRRSIAPQHSPQRLEFQDTRAAIFYFLWHGFMLL